MNSTESHILELTNHTKMLSKGLILFVLGLTISLLSLSSAFAQNPFIPKYDAVKRSERCFTVTWEANNQFGAVWWADKVDFDHDTAFNFVVYMGDRDGNGADGLAFVMHQDPRDTITDPSKKVIIGGAGTWDLGAATGDDGGGLGYAMHNSRVGPNTIPGPHGPGDSPENHKIQKSVAVELDTWNNTDVPDGRNGADANGVNQPISPFYGWDHTSVVYNGDIYGGQQLITDAIGTKDRILPLKPAYAFGNGNNPDGSVHHNIEDDRCYLFQIKWIVNPDGTQTLQLWADVYNGTTNTDGLQMIMTHSDDMINKVFGGNPTMRFGFTGSTGGSINEQTICLLGENLKPFAQDDYASIPMNTEAIIDVESNDNDPDGDELHVPIIIDQARYGTAVIFENNDINYMRYNPNTNYVGMDTIGYVTCDVNSTKCYAKCDTAWVYINVGCIPFDISVNTLSPNTACNDTVPASGVAEAQVTSGNIFGILWSEDFDALANGTKSTSKWNINDSNAAYDEGRDHAEVRNKRISISDIGNHGSGKYITWSSEVIDISSVTDVSVTVDLQGSNKMEGNANEDYIRVYYKIDGGAEVPLANGIHAGGPFTATASVSGLSGNSIQIIARATNSANDEFYYIDNVIVQAAGAGTANVSYNWYKGPSVVGTPDFIGQIYNNMHSGQYTVVAKDLNTGCLSNPQTITIDSNYTKPPGGYIIQAAPFTNCQLPYDGQLEAGVFNGTDSTQIGYLFQWYVQEDPTTIIQTGYIAGGLRAREYTVQIIDLATGCDTTMSAEVPNAVAIPLVTANKIADITSCIDPNSGIGAANVAGVTAGYRFEWFNGPAIGAGPPNFYGSNVNTFPAGNFTVQAIDSATMCPSDPATITIQDVTETPIIDLQLIAQQTSCDPIAPNGELFGAVDVSGTPTIAGYAFNWYRGANDLPANLVTTGSTASGLAVGPYRLVVIEDGTNCTSFYDTLINDATVAPPAITLTATDVTSCDSPNGTITVALTVGQDPADYIFDVYRGNGVVSSRFIKSTSNLIITDLSARNYTIVGKNKDTKCETLPVTIRVNDAKILPNPTITAQNQGSCDPANLSGSLTVTAMAMGAISDYTYAWFEDAITGASVPASGTYGEIISGIDSGDYALQVTNNISKCTNTFFPSVNIGIVLPVETVSAVASTYCAPNGNGELHATVVGQAAPFTGYTFIWESVDNGTTLTEITPDVSGVEPGDYMLTIRDLTTACLSNPAPVTVNDNTVVPMPVLAVTDNSSCDITNPNGQIEVSGTNEDPTLVLGLYAYVWTDNGTGTPLGSTTETVSALSAGTYELQIQNTFTSCSNAVLSQIIDINIKPVITDYAVVDASYCATPYQSSAEVTEINGSTDLTGYTFEWTNLSGGPAIPATSIDSLIADIDGSDEILPPGNYQVIAYNSFNCPSDPITFEIRDISIDPVFTLDAYNNISCDPGIVVGSLVASRPLGSTYSISQYEWFNNNTSLPPFSITSPDSVLLNQGAGTFAVRITDALTGCQSVEYATILNQPDNEPVLSNTYINGLTSCVDPNGEFGLAVAPVETIPTNPLQYRSYTFYTENSATPPDITAGSTELQTVLNPTGVVDNKVDINKTTDPGFTTINAGDWTSIVVDNFTKCASAPLTINISSAPDIIITVLDSLLPADCDALSTGSYKFEASSTLNSSPGGMGYDYTWSYLGPDVSGIPSPNPGTIDGAQSDGDFIEKRDGLYSGYYVVSVDDRFSGCIAADTFYLPIITSPPAVFISKTDATQCLPGNGEIRFEVAEAKDGLGNPISLPPVNYEIVLFTGSSIDPVDEIRRDALVAYDVTYEYGPGAPPSDFAWPLSPGKYTIATQQTGGNNCYSQPTIVEIGLDFEFPDFAFAITPDNSCVGGTPTGQITENSPILNGNINYSWHTGIDDGALSISGVASTPANSLAGNYYLISEVINNIPGTSNGGLSAGGLGCFQDSIASIKKQLDVVKLAIFKTDNNNCAPFDGTIEITDIKENGGSLGAPPAANYANYYLFDSGKNAYVPTKPVYSSWSGIEPGQYYLQALNTSTNCLTDFAQVVIDDLSVNPKILVSVGSPDFGCDPMVAKTGELTASVTPLAGNLATDYLYEWTGTTDSNTPYGPAAVASVNALESGVYSVKVTDNTGANLGCISDKTVTLLHKPTTVSILSADIGTINQTICGPNGSVSVNQIFENDGSGAIPHGPIYVNYSAQLLSGNLTPINTGTNPYAVFDPVTGAFGTMNVPAATYYIQAANIANGCAYGQPIQVIIKDLSKKPIISAVLDSPDFACFTPDPGNLGHTGQLTPTAIGGSDGDIVVTNFDFEWSSSITPSVPGGTVATNLWPDTYTIRVRDNDGADFDCVSTRVYKVPTARHQIVLAVSGTDQTICTPDGTIQIDNISVDGGPNVVDPHLTWTAQLMDQSKSPIIPAPAESGFASDMPYADITAGTYFVRAQDNSTKCYSNSYQVVLDDISTDPIIAINLNSPQYSLNPNTLSWTGEMTASVSEVGAAPAGPYTNDWYKGQGVIGASLATTDNIAMLDSGMYTFVARNTTTGCESEYSKYLPYQRLEPTFNTMLAAKTICSPNDGGIAVTDVDLDGNPDMLDEYRFRFYDNDYSTGDVHDYQVDAVPVVEYNNIDDGNYYIIARENWWWIESYPVKVVVIDSTTNPIIMFDATNYQALTSCDPNVYANGALAIEVYEDSNNPNLPNPVYPYTYAWYTGTQINNANLIPNSNSNMIADLPSGNFTVRVINDVNNCMADQTFTIQDKSVTPVVAPTMTPVTNCPVSMANGIVTARVINSTERFDFLWYAGSQAKPSPDFTGNTWYGKTIGDYTVVAVDRQFGTCISAPANIVVEDATVNPKIKLSEIHPITNCDPERPNAVVSASADGGVSKYTFEWFLNDNLYYTGPVASNLGNGIYKVVVTNNVTKCVSDKSVVPSVLFDEVPAPDVEILADRTSCLSPDGSATATIKGNAKDYIFNYYRKYDNASVDNLFENNVIYDLDTSTYIVTAENRVSGCVSKPTEFAIANETYYPQIDIITDPSNCQDPSGTANVIISDETREYKVTWFGENGFQEQLKEIVYLPIGKYVVEVEGTDGCITSAEAEVKGDILIYNGVSANYDGYNDFFQVICLEYFPENNVKIYNRGGMLVYEQDHYNMNDPAKRFEGVSNKGTSILGKDLPIGTYFYVVDKNDGSKPKVGYLELNR